MRWRSDSPAEFRPRPGRAVSLVVADPSFLRSPRGEGKPSTDVCGVVGVRAVAVQHGGPDGLPVGIGLVVDTGKLE